MRNSNSELISICIPTYNGERFIADALDSAITQTYSNLEIIISDDASSDNTLKIVESYKAKTNIPIIILHHKPKGIGANWNNCIKKANSHYIKFLFQDDVLEANCVESMLIDYKKSSADLMCCKRSFIVEDSFRTENYNIWIETYKNLQKDLNLNYNEGIALIDHKLFKRKDLLHSPINKFGEPSTMFFKKSLVEKVGYFREDLKQVLDYEFCYRVLKHSKIGIIEAPLIRFRLHAGQTTVKNKDGDIYKQDHETLMKLLYTNYLNKLNSDFKKSLLRKYNPAIRIAFNSVDGLKTIFKKIKS